MRYLHVTAIRQLAHANGKRVSPGYLAWLDARVESIITADSSALRGCKTLNADDAAARAFAGRLSR